MKSRLTLIVAALVVLLGAIVCVIEDRPAPAATPAMAVTTPIATELPAAMALAPIAPAAVPAPLGNSSPMVHIDAAGEAKYVARAGDTVSNLAIALMGSDSKEHRDAVIAANPSLQPNPDRVLEGQTYSVAGPSAPAVDDTELAESDAPDSQSVGRPTVDGGTVAGDTEGKAARASGSRKLMYVAQPGDTVGILAANLLGGNTAADRETITGANASLRTDPDHLVAGQTYTIPAPDGLAAETNLHPAPGPTTQPEADDAARASVGRALSYTALLDDTVSKLAVVLLGSDTPSNRDLIIKSNPTLKQNPDHLVAGQTYWIDAPTAEDAH